MKKNAFRNEVVKPLKEKDSLMRLNRFLANKYITALLAVLLTAGMFFLGNYVINVCSNAGAILNDLENTASYLGVRNFFELNVQNWIAYLILAVLIAFVVGRLCYQFRTSFKDLDVGQKGTDRFATLNEIKREYRGVPLKSKEYNGDPGIPVCVCGNTVYIDDSMAHTCVTGIPRSGKGETVVYKSIDLYSRAKKKASMIITDPKLELFPSTYKTLEKRGYDVYVLDLMEPLKSTLGFNPLQTIIDAYKRKDYDEAELLCNSICYSIFKPEQSSGDNKYWVNTATQLLSALILALVDDCLKEDARSNTKAMYQWKKKQADFETLDEEQKSAYRQMVKDGVDIAALDKIPSECEYQPTTKYEKQINLYSVYNICSRLAEEMIDEQTTALDLYFRERPIHDRARLKYSAMSAAGSTKTKGSTYSTMLQEINVFISTQIAMLTAESSMDLKNIGFGEKPVAIFLGIPDYDRSNHVIASIFISQVYFILSKHATRTRDNKCPRRVLFLLDEFGNLPAIENMANMITVGLGRNLQFILITHDDQQVEAIYGKSAKTIINNCANQYYILTNDMDTLKRYSDLLGNKTIVDVHRTGKKLGWGKTYMEQNEQRALLTPTELRRFKEGDCVIVRTVKRRDRNSNHIEPLPIYNTGATRFPYRYEHMLDDFPDDVVYEDLGLDGLRVKSLDGLLFDIDAYYEKKLNETPVSADMQTTMPPQNQVSSVQKPNRVCELNSADYLLEALSRIADDEFNEQLITVDQAVGMVQEAAQKHRINEGQYKTLIGFLTDDSVERVV